MQTLHQSTSTSRFTSIANLARLVAQAPLGSRRGVPCVYAGIENDEEGRKCLVAKTLDPEHCGRLVLKECSQDLVHSNYDYLVQRLKGIGFAVVESETQLQLA